MQYLGGVPVDQKISKGIVQQAVELFETHEQFVLGLAPEGTRSQVTQWRTGVHHIAAGAGVSIVPAYLDFSRRRVGFGGPIEPAEDAETTLEALKSFYAPYMDRGARSSKAA